MTLETTPPTNMAELISKGYFKSSSNTNGFGGSFEFVIDNNKGIVIITTTILDASVKNAFINSYKNTFKPVQGINPNEVETTFVLPTSVMHGNGAFMTGIPVQASSPNASDYKYWYDTSDGTAKIKVSDGNNWVAVNTTSSGSSTTSIGSSIITSANLPTTTGVEGDLKYVYDEDLGTVFQYVYYNGGWVVSGGAASQSKYINIANGTRYWSDNSYATSCLKYIQSDVSGYNYTGDIGSGVYKIDPDGDGGGMPFDVYCDMSTDGGGWTLVWSNLRDNTALLQENMTWGVATGNGNPMVVPSLNDNEETFQVYTPLTKWNDILNIGQILYKWKPNYSTPIAQMFKANITQFSSTDKYRLNMSNYVQLVGSITAGIYSYHNGRQFTTYDNDNDIYGGNCSSNYSNTPFWYGACWEGNINGGGAPSGGTEGEYFNGAFWYSSHRQAGDSNGAGGGNGWIYIK